MTDPQVIVNLGTGGSDLNGQNGSTSSADSNDARFLDWPGDNAGNYVYLPGVSGNYLSVPDEAALDITGDIDIRVRVALDDWSPSSTNALVSKYGSSGLRSYLLQLTSAGTLQLVWSEDGSAVLAASVSAPSIDDEAVKWIRATLDVDNGASGRDIKFYTSDDGSSWSQVGVTVTQAGTTSIYATSQSLNVGSHTDGASSMTGKVYRAQVLDGIDGTAVLDADTSLVSSGSDTSFTAATGQTVTINRSTSGRKSVAVVSPVWLFGTDDYMEVADNALLDFDASDDFTVLAILRLWDTPINNGRVIVKLDLASFEGWELRLQSSGYFPRAIVWDGSSTIENGSSVSEGSVALFGFRVDRTAGEFSALSNNAISTPDDISTAGGFANSEPVRIGARNSTPITFGEFELIATAVFRRALTQAEITALTTYYQNRLS